MPYKMKLMVLNGRVFPASSSVLAMKHIPPAASKRRPMGDEMSSATVVYSRTSLTAHINLSLVKLHYHDHSRLVYGITATLSV